MAALSFSAPELAAPMARMLATLTRGGHGVWVVGGWVRDQVRGVTAHDADFCTSADALAIERAARAAGVSVLLDQVAAMHGTYRLAAAGQVFDLARLRQDVQRLGARHAEVQFTRELAPDLARRDLTINALALPYPLPKDPASALVDAHGGLDDLRGQMLRLIGAPDQRLQEDPLRLLRVARFAALGAGWRIEAATAAAMARCAPLVATVSTERRLAELQRALASACPERFWQAVEDSGAWSCLLPVDVSAEARARASAALAAVAAHHTDPLYRWASFVLAGVAPPGDVLAEDVHASAGASAPADVAGAEAPRAARNDVFAPAAGAVLEAGRWLAPLRFSRAWQQACTTVVQASLAVTRLDNDERVVRWALALGPARLQQLAAWASGAQHAAPLAELAAASEAALRRTEGLRAGRTLWRPQQLELRAPALFDALGLPAGSVRGDVLHELLVHVWLHPADNAPDALHEVARRLAPTLA